MTGDRRDRSAWKVEARTLARDRIVAEFSALPEGDKSYVMGTVIQQCYFAGSVFTRGDVEDALNRLLTVDEWARIRESPTWTRSLEERMTEQGWDVIHPMLDNLGIRAQYELDEDGEQVGL